MIQEPNQPFRLIVAGSRHFKDYALVEAWLSALLKFHPEGLVIISGGAQGADRLGEKFALQYKLPLERYPADWDKHGPAAGPIRNRKMAGLAHGAIIFWDGVSRGSANMIQEAKAANLQYIQVVQV